MNLTPKYYVFKQKEYDLSLPGIAKPLDDDSFFVIRKQDIMGSHALWAYIGVLRVASQLTKNPDLINLADELFDLAVAWDEPDVDKKLPD